MTSTIPITVPSTVPITAPAAAARARETENVFSVRQGIPGIAIAADGEYVT